MSLFPRFGSRRVLIALGAFVAFSTMLASPAFADHGYRGARTWRPHGPRVGVFVGVPPVVLVAGRPAPYYGPYERRYDGRARAYQNAYADGFDDGYDDRAREEWRRRERSYHSHYGDCDHWR
ncbi:MAG TPA: hypothetical protein VII78_18775 [Myxococcota bacterium]|jgi:hypothetical protein